MQNLTDKFWKSFNSKTTSKKGKKFEELIKTVLEAKYGQNKWKGTSDSWDGSKDFYYYNIDENMWAECKNYKSTIGLKVVSPTLIMAQIYNIDTLLFFSYSPINDNTKSKIVKYSDNAHIKVIFFDDEALEKLLFNYWSYISKKNFKRYNGSTSSYFSSPLIDLKIYKNPFSNESEIPNNDIGVINAYHMFEIDICIVNPNDMKLSLEISFNDFASKDLQFFEINPSEFKTEPVKLVIPPYESFIYKVFMSPTCGGRELQLPDIQINNNAFSLNKNFEIKPIKCKITRENRLIGEEYRNLIRVYSEDIINNKIALTLYGGSGVGKSRLFTECIKISAFKNYVILSNFTSYHSINRLSDAENLIKEIIIALYDLTSEEVLELFNQIASNALVTFDEKTSMAFQMIKDFINASTTDKYFSLIDKYIAIISEKLMQRKYLIAIDNMQFYDESISYFFYKVLSYIINSQRPNLSRFLFTFNTDYIGADTLSSELLLFLTENSMKFCKKKIIGFQNGNECEVYLQEALSIGDSMEENEIKTIINKTNGNPLYLQQMVLWLYEKGVLNSRDNKYNIQKPEELLNVMNDIPQEIFDLLNQRWDFFTTLHSEADTVQALSAIHLFSFLTRQDAEDLKIDWLLIEQLEKRGFLDIISDKDFSRVTFYHDMLESFISNKYFPLSKYICDNELTIQLISKQSKGVKSLFDLCKNKWDNTDTIRDLLSQDIPVKLSGEYYFLLYKAYLKLFDKFKDKSEWMSDVIQLMGKIRDHLGNEKMLSIVNEINFAIEGAPNLKTEICYGRFLLTISESMDSIGQYQEAHDLILNYKNLLEVDDICDDKRKKFLSELYNRLNVYRRHQCYAPLEDSLSIYYIQKAIQLSKETKFYEMEYVNNSDMGYLYYSLPAKSKEADYTLQFWERAIEIFEGHNIPGKTLNYIRKCVQVALIRQNTNCAINKCKEALTYIEYGEYSYQKLFFRWWFNLAMAESYLQDISNHNLKDVNICLIKAQECADLLKTNKKYYVLFLRAIYYYYNNNRQRAGEYLENCFNLLENSNYASKARNLLRIAKINREIIAGSLITDTRNHLVSQITTKDNLFNLLCL